MKIEKINDNQIKCTLNKSDLASRQIKLSELAYGTDKAKSLFRDMMQQASFQFGFEAEDIPLMIEAIPVSADCIVLVITKVEDPDELDTRFSKFTYSTDPEDMLASDSADSNDLFGADEILDIFKNFADGDDDLRDMDEYNIPSDSPSLPVPPASGKEKKIIESKRNSEPAGRNHSIIKLYSFDNLDTIIQLSHVLQDLYNGENSLYKSEEKGLYFLVVTKSGHSPEEFNKVCNILSEYGNTERSSYASWAHFEEFCDVIISNSALQKLALL
ncbi:adaptor protein MecA [Parasporobacterium paucivorans]|uniref:Adapter protein MecA 1/2 n=1 Tax=Parasporobacterium paucivorans DSM 15970 TaxID=1122934 RepID=A0A1M6CPB5_9FIRM|nr:adaptor protein MecA [Parasporobacterium paucivorans]SHI62681.1 adapter protein MecA 1/2 [Parasporobacterium paucivorans DSM 15970]